MTKTTITLGLAALLTMGGARASADEPTRSGDRLDPADLVGGYTIVSGEHNGQPEPAEKIKGTTVRFTADAIAVISPDKTEIYAATYTLESGQEPCRITMTSKLSPEEEQVARGLIEKRGDTLRLIYALPGGMQPTEFKTLERQLMFVMKTMSQ